MESKFRSALMVSADTPESLRASDVYRVLYEAEEMDVFHEFKTWLLSQNLQSRTREVLNETHNTDNR